MKMKILIATDTYKPMINGVVMSIITLQFGLAELGHDVRILTLSETTQSYMEGNVYYIGAYDVSNIYPDAKMKIKRGKEELHHILNWKPDIIHTQSEFTMFHLAKKISKRLSIPMVHTYHTMYEDYTHYFSPSKTMGKKTVKKLANYISNHVQTMIAPTNKIYNVLKEYDVTCPIRVIPSGIHLEKFQISISQAAIGELKNDLNIPRNNWVMLSVSRIGKEKNIDELIRYMKSLKDNNISLVIVGDGPYRTELERLTKFFDLENNIIFAGMVHPKYIPTYYQMANIFVSASTSETQGLTYIEALASGTPILCKRDECLDDVLIEGVNGYAFDDENEFFLKLNIFANYENISKMRLQSKNSVMQYSNTHFVNRINELYKQNLDMYKAD